MSMKTLYEGILSDMDRCYSTETNIPVDRFDNFRNKVEIYKITDKGKNIDAVMQLCRYNNIKNYKYK